MRAGEPVNRVMSASVLSVAVDAPVTEVLRIFLEYPVHHLPVVNEAVVVGMLSSADMMKLEFFLGPPGTARDRLLNERFQVRTLMRAPPITVSSHDSVERAAELMASNGIHSLPVVNSEGRLIGIVTTTDIMAGFLNSASSRAPDDATNTEGIAQQRLLALKAVAREARRYLNAGQDEQLHAALAKAIAHLQRLDERTNPAFDSQLP